MSASAAHYLCRKPPSASDLQAEPSYFFNNRAVFALMLLINWLTPPVMKSALFVFLQKR
jgi:hypothetical protein